MSTIKIHDVTLDEVIEREMTVNESKAQLAEIKEGQIYEEKALAKAAAKQLILDKLGLSAEEAKSLLS